MTERTDRELLELAAKAAGIAPDKSSTNGGGAGNTGFDILGNLVLDWHDGITWNPLDDDGDALRLMAALGLEVMWHRDGRVEAFCGDPASPTVWESSRENRQGNLRRAIVRAAAAMAEGGEHG